MQLLVYSNSSLNFIPYTLSRTLEEVKKQGRKKVMVKSFRIIFIVFSSSLNPFLFTVFFPSNWLLFLRFHSVPPVKIGIDKFRLKGKSLRDKERKGKPTKIWLRWDEKTLFRDLKERFSVWERRVYGFSLRT